jgi:hypothetical protein
LPPGGPPPPPPPCSLAARSTRRVPHGAHRPCLREKSLGKRRLLLFVTPQGSPERGIGGGVEADDELRHGSRGDGLSGRFSCEEGDAQNECAITEYNPRVRYERSVTSGFLQRTLPGLVRRTGRVRGLR